jgi:molybdopterin-guanine dinucleotide biosynthesis protein A
MATGIILAGGESKRMPVDKAFMEIAGLRVIDMQLEVIAGLFEDILVVGNAERMERLSVYTRDGVSVLEEPVKDKGPLGGILSGLLLSGTDENFILACDMPFIKRQAVAFVMDGLAGYQVSVPRTPDGLEPLHAAYRRDCIDTIAMQLDAGNLKITDFYGEASVHYLPWEELRRFDPAGRLLYNINSPEDMKGAAGFR